MAFVSRAVLDEWRTRTSWVYKGFAYLFQNKLWKKRIPSGFSTCPYFWMAIFSYIFFRPVIEPVVLGVRALLKGIMYVGGKPILWWDKWVRSKTKTTDSHEAGFGILMTIAAVVLTVLAGIVLTVIGYLLHQYYLFSVEMGMQWMALLIYGVINAVSIIITSVYNHINRREKNRCRTEWYSVSCLLSQP